MSEQAPHNPEAYSERSNLSRSLTDCLLEEGRVHDLPDKQDYAFGDPGGVQELQTKWLSVPGYDGVEISLRGQRPTRIEGFYLRGTVILSKNEEGKVITSGIAQWRGWSTRQYNSEGCIFSVDEANRLTGPIETDSEEFQIIRSVYGRTQTAA